MCQCYYRSENDTLSTILLNVAGALQRPNGIQQSFDRRDTLLLYALMQVLDSKMILMGTSFSVSDACCSALAWTLGQFGINKLPDGGLYK